MAVECFSQVRGSAIRVTSLNRRGNPGGPVQYAADRAIAKVTINEVTESGSSEMMRNDEDERRLLITRPTQTVRYLVDIDFLRVDPGMLTLMTGVPVVYNAAGDVVGFDYHSRLPVTAFALEVWSKLAGRPCADRPAGFGEGDFGEFFFGGSGDLFSPERMWGYTLFPFLKGGTLSGFSFANGAVTFNLRRAQTRRAGQWGVGPFDLYGPHQRLVQRVSGNTSWRNMLLPLAPPEPTNGIVESTDIIDGGTATMTTDDVLDSGSAAESSPWIVDGGRA